MNRTLPSAMPTLTPPGCLLRRALVIPRPVYVPPLEEAVPVEPMQGILGGTVPQYPLDHRTSGEVELGDSQPVKVEP